MNICKHIPYQIIRRMHNDEDIFHRNSVKIDVKNIYLKNKQNNDANDKK